MAAVSIVEPRGKEDFVLYRDWLAQEAVWKYLGPPFAEGAMSENALAFAAKKGTSAYWTVLVDDQAVGLVGLSDICHYHHRANLWYVRGESCEAKGVMKEATGQLLARGFGDLNLHSLHAWAIAENPASIRILEHLGMTRFGTQPEAFCFDGRYVDIVWFQKLL